KRDSNLAGNDVAVLPVHQTGPGKPRKNGVACHRGTAPAVPRGPCIGTGISAPPVRAAFFTQGKSEHRYQRQAAEIEDAVQSPLMEGQSSFGGNPQEKN